MVTWHRYPTRAVASAAAAERLAAALRVQLQTAARATLVVCGGSTPGPCFQELSKIGLPWHRVDITLTDERCLPDGDPDRNESLLRQTLLRNCAAAATFVPLNATAIAGLAAPFACTLLGMGVDGHIASLFPDASNLDSGVDLRNEAQCLRIQTKAGEWPRISMTLRQLTNSQSAVLLAFGMEKQRVLNNPAQFVVGHLLRQNRCPVDILWAP